MNGLVRHVETLVEFDPTTLRGLPLPVRRMSMTWRPKRTVLSRQSYLKLRRIAGWSDAARARHMRSGSQAKESLS